nr:hypothetical protein [Pseudomonas sp. P818]
MAGDWIKFELTTLDKPEVCQIADLADIDLDAVVGKLLRVWGWFDQQTENGNAPSVSKKLLDRLVGVTGFCEHMKVVGWMIEEDGVISLPRFERHNGKTAKNRLLTAKRVANHKAANARGNDKGNAPTVSYALPREDVEKIKDQEQEPPLPPEGETGAAATVGDGKPSKPEKPSKPLAKFDPLTACPQNVTPSVWARWVKCRKELGKPLKETTCEAQAHMLADCANPDAVLEKSIANGWQGLFPDSVTAKPTKTESRHTGLNQINHRANLGEQNDDGSYPI